MIFYPGWYLKCPTIIPYLFQIDLFSHIKAYKSDRFLTKSSAYSCSHSSFIPASWRKVFHLWTNTWGGQGVGGGGNSLGKPAVGRTECSEVWSYIKRLKSELKSILRPNKQFIFFNWSSMDMYTIKDFGSSRFNHNSQNRFSVYQDSQTTKTVDHSITKITFPPSMQTINKRIVFKSQKSKHLSTTWISMNY